MNFTLRSTVAISALLSLSNSCHVPSDYGQWSAPVLTASSLSTPVAPLSTLSTTTIYSSTPVAPVSTPGTAFTTTSISVSSVIPSKSSTSAAPAPSAPGNCESGTGYGYTKYSPPFNFLSPLPNTCEKWGCYIPACASDLQSGVSGLIEVDAGKTTFPRPPRLGYSQSKRSATESALVTIPIPALQPGRCKST
ncbi:hypothetical protein EJ08DRAFT_702619 [Tothia fuscella]|uniref:Uncharacterized protein n=1 Tax=Tothia fuscella TaxID=1048955 RepID=A0A9P4NGH9_9PEZI|nr:hypothetical protein EJ08DRAFT_702619 [Tothia fuscella]